MIKHLGEALVPFATDGFDRQPETPLVGEPVMVACRVDGTGETPTLTLRTQAGETELTPEKGDGRFFTFALGAFDAPQTARYRIQTASEQTPWFSFEVSEEITVRKPLGVYRDGDALQIALSADVTLRVSGGETLCMEVSQTPATGEPFADVQQLALPEGFSFFAGSDFLWRLNRLSETVCDCESYTLRRDVGGRVNHLTLGMRMTAGHVLGTGERFDAVEMAGRATNGRVVEKFTAQGDQSYLPIPFFMTEQGFGWYRVSDIPAEMRFEALTTIAQETEGVTLTRDELTFGKPLALVERFVARTGTPVLPPEWAFGVWISGNGWNCDAEVEAQLAALKRFRYPATVMVLEQWSDERTFYLWHPTHWKDPEAMVRRVREAGLHMVLWQIPVIKHEWNGDPGEALLSDIRVATERGYAVKSADGTPYRINERWFHHSMLPDFTNPEAVRWWFGKREPLLAAGVEGFKTDGGEFLFEKTARLHNGLSGLAAHNLYPAQYVGAYHDFFRSQGVEGVLFSRAGYVGAQTQPIHWAGDQHSEWSEFAACLTAGISAGLSGVLFWSFDISGFAGPIPGAELYLRATAMGCFCPVMQWHAEPRTGQFEAGLGASYNNDRSPWNLAEKLGDPSVLSIACEFANLREQLRPYLWREANYCAANGRPMMAHLCLDFPDDPLAYGIHDQYLLGRELLVAPLTREGENTREVYLPQGEWTDYFTGETLRGGQTVRVTCPLTRIPVYRRRGCHAGCED